MRKTGILLLLIILIITFSIVVMKKKSLRNGGDTKIAYWNFDSNILGKKKFSLSETVNKESISNGYIAPGANGEFEIVLDARKTQVDIVYDIQLEKEQNTPSNIIFSTYVNNSKKSFKTLKEMFEKVDFSGIIKINENRKKIYKIFWEWPYENYLENGEIDEEKDLKDYEFGISNLDYIFYIKVNAMQSK